MTDASALARKPATSRIDLRDQRLVERPSHRQADEDLAFLQRPEMCGARLQLEMVCTRDACRLS
jgi:hypothetical protein